MLRGDLAAVAAVALRDGARAGCVRLQVGRPVAPMLAGTAADVGAALAKTGPAAVDWKLDGARLQVHRDGDDVAVFTRTLDDVTARVPEVVAAARALPVRAIVLDGEGIALRPDGRPEPFQVTAAASGRAARARRRSPRCSSTACTSTARTCSTSRSRGARMRSTRAAAELRVPRRLVEDADGAAAMFDAALAAGHEGVVVKALAAPYAAGRRGSGWLKVKPVHTLDLVVLAAEWGTGGGAGGSPTSTSAPATEDRAAS